MLDRHLKPGVDRALSGYARFLHRHGVTANQVTWIAFVFGMTAALAISQRSYLLGLILMLVSRIYDALDGAVARLGTPTDKGAFLDITLDFLFYASIPLAFAWAAPVANGLPAAVLLAAFLGTGSSFLAYAVLAEKKGLHTNESSQKGFFFLGGLTEATETIVVFALMCLFPQWFAWLAIGFAGLCAVTIASRIWYGLKHL